MQPPEARRSDFYHEAHGHRRIDPYHWLRVDNWQEVMRDTSLLDDEVKAHLDAENAYTQHVLKPSEAFRDDLFEELKGRYKQDDSSVPRQRGPWFYYGEFSQGDQYPRVFRAKSMEKEGAELLLDLNAIAAESGFLRMAMGSISPDNRYYAFALDRNGSEYFTVQVLDTKTGKLLPDEITSTDGSFAWLNNGKGIVWTELDDKHRPVRVRIRTLGAGAASDGSDDPVIYEEKDPGFFLSVHKDKSQRYVVLSVNNQDTSQQFLLDADGDGSDPLITVGPRQTGLEYYASHRNNRLILLTNQGGAKDRKIMSVRVDNLAAGPESWKELIGHRSGTFIDDVQVLQDWLIRIEKTSALPRIVVTHLDSGEEHEISVEDSAYDLSIHGDDPFDSATVRYVYESPRQPAQTFDYDLSGRTGLLRKAVDIPSGHDPAGYVVKRLHAPARDGMNVPVTLLYHKDTAIDGSAPVLLYGYGSYAISMDSDFAPNAFSLVDRGFIYAVAHIRGGGDMGDDWFKSARGAGKQLTFNDFNDCADFLIAEGYTKAGEIACMGGSAGGMLMGVVVNERPELYRACVAQVPFVDVLTTMSDASLPLTPPEWPEWGNPIESEADYDVIAAYSPVDNLKEQPYPHILATGGLTDPRVTYWEPAKWVQGLRDHNQPDGGDLSEICLHMNMTAGHGGASGRFDRLRESALSYGFILQMFNRVQ